MRCSSVAALVFASAPFAFAQPAIATHGVLNAASYVNPSFPNGSIAQGSLFLVFGNALGPAALVQSSTFPLPSSIGGTSVKVTSGATSLDAVMIYSSAKQVAAILPSTTPTGAATVTVTYNGQTSPPEPIKVVPASIGIFTANQAGFGPAIVTDVDYQVHSVLSPFTSGQNVIVWATGGGKIAGSDATAPPIGNLSNPIDIWIGNQWVPASYYGRSGCCAGLDQYVVQLPANAPQGCYVPVAARANGIVSNYGTIAIADSGTCSGYGTLPASLLQTLQSGGTINAGSAQFSRFNVSLAIFLLSLNAPTDTGSAVFTKYDAASYASAFGLLQPTPGTCLVLPFNNLSAPADPIKGTPLDAGSSLTIAGSNGSKAITKTSTGNYYAVLGGGIPGFIADVTPGFLDPGNYTFDNGAGGSDVGPFKSNLTVAQPLVWSNRNAIASVDRTQPLTITWSGGDPSQYVLVEGASGLDLNSAAAFMCTETIAAGTLTVPASVLGSLPASGTVLGGPAALLGIGAFSNQVQTGVRGLDVLTINAGTLNAKQIAVK